MGDTTVWRCAVCGYIHREPAPPDPCPVCGAAAQDFEAVNAGQRATPRSECWRCLNCEYLHRGSEPPAACPVCGAKADRFVETEVGGAGDGTSFSGQLVVVGAGIAGLSAVEAFRETTAQGSVTLLGAEADLPYYRLNLTRYLAGEVDRSSLTIHPADWYARHRVDLRLGVDLREIDGERRRVVLGDGQTLAFDRLILTAGAHPFLPPIPGHALAGVTALRTLEDADRILTATATGGQAVIIGGGILGIEIAGALSRRGLRVAQLEAHDWPMPRQLNARAGELLAAEMARRGIDLIRRARTAAIQGDDRVRCVVLEDGRNLPADLVVIATGVRANSHLGRRLGLEVNQGIVVDNHLRSSRPDLLAAGDVAEHHGVMYGTWSAAQYQGSLAGRNAAGLALEFGGLPRSNTLKVLGLDLISIGTIEPVDGSYRIAEDEIDGIYRRFVLRDGRLLGAVLLGDTSLAGPAKKAIESGRDLSFLPPSAGAVAVGQALLG